MSDSGFAAQRSSISPLPPPVIAATPTTRFGTGFDGGGVGLGVLGGVSDGLAEGVGDAEGVVVAEGLDVALGVGSGAGGVFTQPVRMEPSRSAAMKWFP